MQHSAMVVCDGSGCSEGILEIAPYLELPEENARCLATLAVQHVSGSAFYQLCEPLMRGLVADGGRALVEVESWPLHREVAGKLGHGGVWLPDEAVSPDIAAPRVITAPCPGRPRGWEDDWASEQVDLLGRDPMEVYAEWLDLMPRERRTRLKDPLNSFRNALSFRRRKRDFDPPLRPPVK